LRSAFFILCIVFLNEMSHDAPMSRVGLIHHHRFLDHDTGHQHPENHERLEGLLRFLKKPEFSDWFDWIEAERAERKHLLLNHSEAYIAYVEKACQQTSALLDDGDTRVCEHSFEAALYAVGAGIMALDYVHRGLYDRIFIASRPPGHHAETHHAMGFCLFNNVAITAKHALEQFGYERVMIIDWDVHHGNGTQNSFYEENRVFFCSLHESPLYPGTGLETEHGIGKGECFTLNIPLIPGSEMDAFREAMHNRILPAALGFDPQLLLISAGFDAHTQDPLANLRLKDEDYFELTELCLKIANQHCNGKMISFLEGGYHHDALVRSVHQHLRCLCGRQSVPREVSG